MYSDLNPEDLEMVTNEYDATLVVPEVKPERQFLLCAVGLIGAGKTTIMTELANKLNLVRINGDDIRKVLYDHKLPYKGSHDSSRILTEKYIRLGHSVALDRDAATPNSYKMITEVAESINLPVIWVHITAPEPVILERLSRRQSWLFPTPDVALENYTARKSLHQNLPMKFDYVFNTSKDNVHEQIIEAVNIILKKLETK